MTRRSNAAAGAVVEIYEDRGAPLPVARQQDAERAPVGVHVAGELMSLVEILPEVQSLPRADKLRLIQVLAQELAEVEGCLPETRAPLGTPASKAGALGGGKARKRARVGACLAASQLARGPRFPRGTRVHAICNVSGAARRKPVYGLSLPPMPRLLKPGFRGSPRFW